MGHLLVSDLKSLSQSFWRHIWGIFMGKGTGSASSDTVRRELRTNFVIWEMSQPNAVALAAPRSSRCSNWSTWSQCFVPGGNSGVGRFVSGLGENPPMPQTDCQSLPFSGMFFPVVCLQQVLFSLLNQVVSVILNIGDVSFYDPQLEATECKNSSFKYFSCFAYNFLFN